MFPLWCLLGVVFALTMMLSQWGQPWANVSLKTLALSVIEDEMTLGVDSGVFNEPISGLMVYVPQSSWGCGSKKRRVYFRPARSG